MTYDAAYFRRRVKYADDYRTLARTLVRTLRPAHVLDVGCGNGLLLNGLRELAVSATGVESAAAAVQAAAAEVRDLIITDDFMRPGLSLAPADLVCCVEVAEHLPQVQADALVLRLAGWSSRWIYFSAAGPYQPGTGHVNCQSQFYWLDRFRERGFELAWAETRAFRQGTEKLGVAYWLHHNGVILTSGTTNAANSDQPLGEA